MCCVLTRIYVPKLGRAIQARRQKLFDDKNHSSKLNDEARSLLENSSTKLLNARAEAAKILRRTSQEVAHEKTRQLQQFDEKLAQQAKAEREKLFAERNNIEANIDKLVTGTVMLAASKLFNTKLAEVDVAKVVDQVVVKESKL